MMADNVEHVITYCGLGSSSSAPRCSRPDRGPADVPVGRMTVAADPFGNKLVLLDLSKGRYVTDAAGAFTGVAAPDDRGHLRGAPAASSRSSWSTKYCAFGSICASYSRPALRPVNQPGIHEYASEKPHTRERVARLDREAGLERLGPVVDLLGASAGSTGVLVYVPFVLLGHEGADVDLGERGLQAEVGEALRLTCRS